MQLPQPSLRALAVTAACSLVAVLSPALFAQTATTDPVGFITLSVPGNGGSGSSIAITGLGLTRPIEYQGSAEAVGANSLTDNEATWTDNQFNGANGEFFVEITSGPGAGVTANITGTNAQTKTITTAESLQGVAAQGVTFKIRKHWTLSSVFGADAANLNIAGGTATTADQVLLWNGTGYDTYYFQTSGIGGVGWRKSGAPTVDQASLKIFPEEGVTIKRKQQTAANIVLMGAVKLGPTSVAVDNGISVIGNVYASGMTLASSGLHDANDDPAKGVAGGTVTSADQVLIWNGTGYDTYYFQTSGIGGVGWRKSGAPTVDASNTPVPVGSAVTIKRKFATGFNWIVPQHPATL
jgi:uncharacterized protein (TIGR02597 family)